MQPRHPGKAGFYFLNWVTVMKMGKPWRAVLHQSGTEL